MRTIAISQPEPVFNPITLTINSKIELASLLGVLLAYGKGLVYSENELKKVGLGDYYNGNNRLAAREFAAQLAEVSGVVPLPVFEEYLNSVKFRKSRKSAAGDAVAGTEHDLAPGRESTNFEGGSSLY